MSAFEKENKFMKVESAVEKADYLVKRIIENYGLDAGEIETQQEAISFANNRENIGMEMEILCDYMKVIQKSLESLRGVVLA